MNYLTPFRKFIFFKSKRLLFFKREFSFITSIIKMEFIKPHNNLSAYFLKKKQKKCTSQEDNSKNGLIK